MNRYAADLPDVYLNGKIITLDATESKAQAIAIKDGRFVDSVSPDNPVMLANGTHMGVANSVALKALGITKEVANLPHGGTALLDKNGDPTGVLTDAQSDVPAVPEDVELLRYYSGDIGEIQGRSTPQNHRRR